jgi:hypothetical protein
MMLMLQARQTPQQNAESDINNLRWCQPKVYIYYYKNGVCSWDRNGKKTTRALPGEFAFLLCLVVHKMSWLPGKSSQFNFWCVTSFRSYLLASGIQKNEHFFYLDAHNSMSL